MMGRVPGVQDNLSRSEAASPSAPTVPTVKFEWEAIERISKALSIVAIPITLAIVGWILQDRLSDKSLRRDYVQLAVSILNERDSSKTNPPLRDWAVDLLNDNSPTKFSAAVVKQLKSGELSLSPQLVSLLGSGRGNVAISPDGKLGLVVDPSGGAMLFDLSSGRVLASFGLKGEVTSAAFSPDGKLVAFGGNTGMVMVVELPSGKLLWTALGHKDVVTGVVFSPDGRTLMTGSLDKTVKTWDLQTGRELRTMVLPGR